MFKKWIVSSDRWLVSVFRLISPIFWLLVVFLLAFRIRLELVVTNPYPLNDGGLIYAFIKTITSHSFRLPEFISYNGFRLPFAYPPLSFFITAAISQLLNISPFQLLRFLPLFITMASLLVVNRLAAALFRSPWYALMATLFFSLIPRSFAFPVMGGGISRSFGQFFSYLTLLVFLKFFTGRIKLNPFVLALPLALLLLSHPEWGLSTLFSLGVFYLFFSSAKDGLLTLVKSLLLTLVYISPWLLTVISLHGFQPLTSAASNGNWTLVYAPLLTLNLTGESPLPIVTGLAFCGILSLLVVKKYFLPVWLVISLLALPRGGSNFTALPLSLCAAYAGYLLFLTLKRQSMSGWGIIFSSIWLICSVGWNISSWLYSQPKDIYLSSITVSAVSGMNFIRQFTPASSRFLVISPDTFAAWSVDKNAEWFPVISQRTSLTTIQGMEWLPNRQFQLRLKQLNQLGSCRYQKLDCLISWATSQQILYSHIFLSSPPNIPITGMFYQDLVNSSQFKNIFSDSEISVWQKI